MLVIGAPAAPGTPSDPEVQHPALGPLGWLRWSWRQLTSMRTALLLLLALAVAAVPGSLIPQRSADPNGVTTWQQQNPQGAAIVDALQGFDVYSSVWFSAIYLLLFVSLVGCVIPRLRHHLRALRAAPPRTPSRFDRLPVSYADSRVDLDPERELSAGERVLRKRGYRVSRYGMSISAERGYLREGGNLLFHFGLLGILLAVLLAGGFTHTGQRVLVTGDTFVNARSAYDSFSAGRMFDDEDLAPFSLTLNRLDVRYEQQNPSALGQPLDYTAAVTVREPGAAARAATIKVNQPLRVAGTNVYLLGNGYAPRVTVRNPDGTVAFSGTVPFRPQDASMTSIGVVKVPDTSDPRQQLGMVGFLYPTAARLRNGASTSIFPSLGSPLVSMNLYVGDLGLTAGAPENVYVLNTDGMRKIAGTATANPAVQLTREQPVATLPGGLGTVTLDGITRFAAFDYRRDPTQNLMVVMVAAAVLGLLATLLIPRRRIWIRVQDDGRVEYAGLARGDDPGLARAVRDIRDRHLLAVRRQP